MPLAGLQRRALLRERLQREGLLLDGVQRKGLRCEGLQRMGLAEIIRRVTGKAVRNLTVTLLVAAALAVGIAMLFALMARERVPEPELATVLTPPLELPEATLVDHAGNTFTTADLEGRFSLMFFGFTYCPDICPLTLQVLARARAEVEMFAPELVPDVVFVSVDPYRDTPERIREYIGNFDTDFTGITGSDEALAPLLGRLGVTVQKNERDGEYYNVIHNGTVYVIGPEAELVAVFTGSSHDAGAIATDVVRIRRRLGTRPRS